MGGYGVPATYGQVPYGYDPHAGSHTHAGVPGYPAPMVPVVTGVPVAPMMVPSPMAAYAVMEPPKSKAAAALLCFFLGWLGVHRFYTGQTGIGLTQLLLNVFLFWTLIVPLVVGMWIFIDFIMILTGGVKDKYGRPLV